MGQVLLCTGVCSEIPYYFKSLGVRVYSAEELCYVLQENAFMLDRELLDKQLVRWIEESLELPQLAASLYPLLRQRTSVGMFVGTILRYVHFYDEETICRTEEIFRQGASLSVYEKLKKRIDYLVSCGRYGMAVLEYDTLLTEVPAEEKSLTADILHNRGVALCCLFKYREAAADFEKAYDLTGDEDKLVSFLAAKRLSMEEGDYISFAAAHPEWVEETLELEKRMEGLRRDWETSDEKQYLDERLGFKEQGDSLRYYEETDTKVEELKDCYRAGAANG